MNNIDKLARIHIKDKKILVTRSKGKELFYIPGGKRENNENDEQALTREIQEELGVQLHRDSINFFETFEAQADGKAEGVMVCMTCYTANYQGELSPNNEIAEYLWCSYADKEKVSAIGKDILEYCKNQKIIE